MRMEATKNTKVWPLGLCRMAFAAATATAPLVLVAASPAFLNPADEKAIRGFFSTYCVECHGPETQKAERRFDRLVLPATTPDSLIDLQDAIDLLNLGDMPPEEAKRHPEASEVLAMVAQLTQMVADGHARLASTGGRTVLRRLNRREYLNTVADLFGLNMTMFDPTTKFPRDEMVKHLDNVGDTLRTSGFLLAQYLDAAEQVVAKAFSQMERPAEQTWRFAGDFRGNRGSAGIGRVHHFRYITLWSSIHSVAHFFTAPYGYLDKFEQGVPVDGWYEIRVKAEARNRLNPYPEAFVGRDPAMPFRLGVVPGNAKIGSLSLPQPIEPLLGEVVLEDGGPEWYTFRVWLDRDYSPRLVFTNGTLDAERSMGRLMRNHGGHLPEDLRGTRQVGDVHTVLLRHAQIPEIRIHEVAIRGPLVEEWPSAGQRAILGDRPFAPERTREILQEFADRAYRRPARTDEIDHLMEVVARRREDGRSPFEAMKDGLKAALCSPAFIYLVEPEPEPSQEQHLTAHALAARLSYFLSATMPDAELRRVADSGELLLPNVLLAQARRLLASPRSEAFVAGFLDGWLNLRTLGDMPPAREEFASAYADDLLPAMKRETQLFTRDLIERNESIVRFLDADYTFVNRPLARLYSMEEAVDPATGHEFRRIALATPQRGGLLGQASVLTVSANGIETSPVTRGVWLLEHLLGTPPAPPPDDVPVIDPDIRGAVSMRDILAKHRDNPACYECHRRIDPLGFALESFDPIGAWRAHYDKGVPIDTSGELPGGQAFEDVAGLRNLLVERKAPFVRALTERLLGYACGRRIEALDRPAIDRILEETAANDYRFGDLLEQVVLSQTFRSK